MYAVLYAPAIRLQALLRLLPPEEEHSGGPLALTDGAQKRSVILEVSEAARRAGVTPGLSAPQGLARCGDLRIFPRCPEREAAAQSALLQAAYSLCPDIESTAPGVCTMRLRLPFDTDWSAFGLQAVALLKTLGLCARAGFAPDPGTALAAAESARPVLTVRDAPAFLEGLPLAALHPPAALAEVLRSWGIREVRQLRALSRGALMERLGAEAGRLHDLACGRAERPLTLIHPPAEFRESFEFGYEIDTLEPLLFILKRMLDQLCTRLRAVWCVAGSMLLILPLECKEEWRRLFSVPSPTTDADSLFRILFTCLETLHLEKRPDAISLQLMPVKAGRDQLRLFETAIRDLNRLGETLARLTALTGANGTGAVQRMDTHRPDVWQVTQPQFHALRAGRETLCAAGMTGLPLRRLRPPLPAAVETAAGARTPLHVSCALANGRVVCVLGPYRLSGAWWEPGAHWSREEWDAELAGGAILRLCRQALTGWTVEGFYELAAETGGGRSRITPFAPPAGKGESHE